MRLVIIGTGIDIIEVRRIQNACRNPRFIKKVFTEEEWDYIESREKICRRWQEILLQRKRL